MKMLNLLWVCSYCISSEWTICIEDQQCNVAWRTNKQMYRAVCLIAVSIQYEIGLKWPESWISYKKTEGRQRHFMTFSGRERDRDGRDTNFKGQRLYFSTPWLHRIFFENVRKRDSKRKWGRGGEKPIMTKTVRKVHKSWLTVSPYLFHVSLMPIRKV